MRGFPICGGGCRPEAGGPSRPRAFLRPAIRGAGVNTGGPWLRTQDEFAGGGAGLEEAVGFGGLG